MRNLILNIVLIISSLSFLPVVSAGDTDSMQNSKMVAYFAEKGLASTNVGGLICANTTWTLAGSPYIVNSSSIVIGCNAELTIEPGVQVRFGSTFGMVVGYPGFGNGTLVARGTEELPIIFTSIKDPCDPCNPAAPGDWSRIHFSDYAIDANCDDSYNYLSGSILEHVIVEYAGYGTWAAVFAEKSSPYLSYCEIRHNSYYGIQVDGTSAPHININDCNVWDNSNTGIYIANGLGHRLTNNNVHHNYGNGIYLDNCSNNAIGGNIIANNSAGGISFGSSGNNGISGNTITNNTGSGIGFYYNYYSGGGNNINGNTVTNNSAGGIYFSICSYSYGGGNTITGNTITNNVAGGINFFACIGSYGGGNTITDNTVTNNTTDGSGGGMCFGGHSGSNTITDNTVTNNTAGGSGGGIYFEWDSGGDIISGNIITNNTADGAGGGIRFGGSGGNTINGNTIIDNMAGGAGGGIYFGSSGGSTLGGNDISSNTSGPEGGGVYLSASSNTTFSGNAIAYNQISGVGTTGGVFVTGESQSVSLAGDPDTYTYNIIRDNDGYQIYNDNSFRGDGLNDVNAVYMNWGTCDVEEIQALIFDFFDNSAKAFVLFYPFVTEIRGDFDGDKVVDLADLVTFCNNWLRADCDFPDWCEGTDLDMSHQVDFFDFIIFAKHWLESIQP